MVMDMALHSSSRIFRTGRVELGVDVNLGSGEVREERDGAAGALAC